MVAPAAIAPLPFPALQSLHRQACADLIRMIQQRQLIVHIQSSQSWSRLRALHEAYPDAFPAPVQTLFLLHQQERMRLAA